MKVKAGFPFLIFDFKMHVIMNETWWTVLILFYVNEIKWLDNKLWFTENMVR